MAAARPGDELGRNRESGSLQRDVRIEAGEIRLRRDRLVLERQDRLDQAGHTRGGFEVAEIGFGRADITRVGARHCPSHGGGEGLDFNGIPERRAGAMRLDEADPGGIDLRSGQGDLDHLLLGDSIRRGEQSRMPVLVHRRTPHDRENPVPVGDGIGEPLQHHHAAALSQAEPVRLPHRTTWIDRRAP